MIKKRKYLYSHEKIINYLSYYCVTKKKKKTISNFLNESNIKIDIKRKVREMENRYIRESSTSK